jgi:hypothetical protein
LELKITAEIVREKSYDPNFMVRVSYDDGKTRFKNELVSVSRKPPRVNIEYPENLAIILEKVDTQKIELEIMRAIVEMLLGNSRKKL